MAVYTVENGQLKRVAECLAEYSGVAWEDGQDGGSFLASMGFSNWDGVEGAYHLYQRIDGDSTVLPGVFHVFDVVAHESIPDFILVGDHLPDYLAVMAMIDPLAKRSYALHAEIAAEQERIRRG